MERLGAVRYRDLWEMGVRGCELGRMSFLGIARPRGAGIYTRSDIMARRAVLAVRRINYGVLCLHSALHVHGLIEREPDSAWVAIPRTNRRPKPLICPLEITWCDAEVLRQGAEVINVDGVPTPVTTVARTIVDCVRFPRKVELELTRSVLQTSLQFGLVGPEELHEEAGRCRARTNVEAELVRIRPELARTIKEKHLEERRSHRRDKAAAAAPPKPLPFIEEDRWLW